MKNLILDKHRYDKWMCINGGKATECLNIEISKEEHDNNSGWTVIKPKRSSKRSFHLRMKEKYLKRKENKI